MSESPSQFIFVTCQAGAEAAARKEMLKLEGIRLAFSCPGFLTFKVEPGSLPFNFNLPVTLARCYGWSLGKVIGDDSTELIKQIFDHDQVDEFQHLHVFERETTLPGNQGYEPGVSILASEIAGQFEQELTSRKHEALVNRVAKDNQKVLDIVMVKPNEWWFGIHQTHSRASRWPGATPIMDTSEEKASRAYYKLKEALLWSGIRIQPGEVCAEIGSSPGGACQLLLEMGAKVKAIDPAELEPEIAEHENLTFIRKRGHEVRKKEFSDVRWLMADLNIAPQYTLDTVREIVTHDKVDVRGMLLTLKLSDWELVDAIPDYMSQVKAMGFQVVKARQLAFNRRECCLMAVKDKFVLRSDRRTKK